jgi:multiple sugar transport system substrate-binding protein
MNTNKIFSLLLLSSLLASCAGIGPRTPTPEPVSLRFAFIGVKEDYQPLVEQFQAQHPSIIIELLPINGDRFQAGYDQLREQFKEADVLRSGYSYLGPDQLAELRPLDDFLVADKTFKANDVFPGLLDALKYQGAQLGVPAGIDPIVMFYENAFFKIANATPPSVGYSIDDFVLAARKVNHQEDSAHQSGQFAYGFCSSPTNIDPLVFTALFGGRLFDNENNPTQTTLDDPANIEAINWYASLWFDENLPPKVGNEPYGAYRFVYGNECGFWIQLFDNSNFMRGHGLDQRMLPLPRAKVPFSYAYWDAYYITKVSEHPVEAWTWVSFLLQHQEGSTVLIPPFVSQIASEGYANRVSADALLVARGLGPDLKFAHTSDATEPWRNNITDLYIQAVTQVVLGKEDAQSALSDAQQQAQGAFQER